MSDGLAITVITTALLLAGWGVLLAVRDRPPGRPTLIALAALELIVAAQVVLAVVLLILGERPDGLVTFLGYHVAALALLPAGALWALADRSRWSSAVVAVACCSVAVMTVRMQQIWSGAGV